MSKRTNNTRLPGETKNGMNSGFDPEKFRVKAVNQVDAGKMEVTAIYAGVEYTVLWEPGKECREEGEK